ncbi:MAG TPA: ribonuclease D [Thermoanaerobaculia bacterium]|nr:ribonuclease D [Thermoanaerobaculia bacterium]
MTSHLLVDSESALADFLRALDASRDEDVPLDTEADSFHHYFEKVCLLQLAVSGRAALVDPLALSRETVAPLVARLQERTLLLHGADFDLRLLYRAFGFRARRIFDSMIAAQLLGEKEVGLSALLQARVGVTLDKAHQRADWSERPIPPERVAYAAADVLHLPALVASLKRDLEAAGRLAWHEEECRRLTALPLDATPDDPENDWRIKGTNALSSRERAYARTLWEVREARAKELDRPPFRVLTNDRLLAAAKAAAAGENDLAKLFPGPRPLPTPFARSVREAIERARAVPPEAWPLPKRGERMDADPALERVVDRLKKKRDEKAQALKLDPGVLASRGVLSTLARALLVDPRLAGPALAEATGVSRWRVEQLL